MRPRRSHALLVLAGFLGAVLLAAASPANGAPAAGWEQFTSLPPFRPGVMFLLTDGRVMVQDQGVANSGTGNWWLLTPDAQGNYADGTWTQAASMASGYAPLYTASAVLPDGRLIIEGGEYNDGVEAWTNQGAIYDSVANTWTTVAPPNSGAGDWAHIGDAPSVVLANGRFLVGDSGSATSDDAILHPANLTWTTTGGTGRIDGNAEAGFTLLPSGRVLGVDVIYAACMTGSAEIFDPASLVWSSTTPTPTPLVACGDLSEIGPQLLTYSGKVFVEGDTGGTALYDSASGTWSSGPSLPVIGGKQFVASDAASAILPDGKVFLDASPGVADPPMHFFLFDGTNLTQVADDASASIESSHDAYMLLLPNGQVMYDYRRGPSSLELYSDGGSPNPAWAPQIETVPSNLAAGSMYAVRGTQLNGLSEGAAFGDDYQMSTDYPLVQITDDNTGTVTYARTSGMTNRSIAPGALSCTSFTLPAGTPQDPSKLRVIANGIASAPVAVTVGATGDSPTSCADFPETLTIAKAGSGSGLVVSTPLGIDCGSTCSHAFAIGTEATLTALSDTGSRFSGWSGGGCAGTGACIVTMSTAETVTATFIGSHALTVTLAGDGAGGVTSSPAGIDCGLTCAHSFDAGTPVTLTSTPDAGSSFAGWSGGGCAGTGTCQITMNADTSVAATFDPISTKPICLVPKLKGKRLGAAKRAIKRAHCRVGKIRRAYSARVNPGRVISQKPRSGRKLRAGTRVQPLVSKGKRPR